MFQKNTKSDQTVGITFCVEGVIHPDARQVQETTTSLKTSLYHREKNVFWYEMYN